jgi:hypothetical protein
MKVCELIDLLNEAQPDSEVYIREQDGDVYTSIGVSYDDIGDVEIYKSA